MTSPQSGRGKRDAVQAMGEWAAEQLPLNHLDDADSANIAASAEWPNFRAWHARYTFTGSPNDSQQALFVQTDDVESGRGGLVAG